MQRADVRTGFRLADGRLAADPIIGPALGIMTLDQHIPIDAAPQSRDLDAAHLGGRQGREINVEQTIDRQPLGQHPAGEVGDQVGGKVHVAAVPSFASCETAMAGMPQTTPSIAAATVPE